MPLPQLLCENPEYLPPALPPKRQRANSKTLNSLSTPPSSPRLCLNESFDEHAELSSENVNNNNVHNKMSLTTDTTSGGSKPLTPVIPTTPSFVVSPSMTSSKSANVPLVSHTSASDTLSMKSPTVIEPPSIQSFETNNHVADVDVRAPIYSNDNRNTNSQVSGEHHYIHLSDGSRGDSGCADKHKPNKNGIECGSGGQMAKNFNSGSAGAGSNSNTLTVNSNSKIKCNNANINNNSNTSDNNEHDDEGIVVLRHPAASMHLQKVRMNFLPFLPLFPLLVLHQFNRKFSKHFLFLCFKI